MSTAPPTQECGFSAQSSVTVNVQHIFPGPHHTLSLSVCPAPVVVHPIGANLHSPFLQGAIFFHMEGVSHHRELSSRASSPQEVSHVVQGTNVSIVS